MILRQTLCILFSVLAMSLKAQLFTDVAEESGVSITYGQCFLAGGISFTDYDMDGDDDILVPSCDDAGIFIYRNDDGQFSLDTAAVFAQLQGRSKAVYAVDLDNDGDREIFVTRIDSSNVLLWNNEGIYTDVSASAGLDDNTYDTFSACFGDYDRDGFIDIYVGNRSTISVVTRNILYRNKGDGTFEEKTYEAGVANFPGATLAVAFVEVNNDGWPDLYVANDKLTANALFINNGDGTFTDASEECGADEEMDGMSVSCTDFNNDGYLDIYVTNTELMGNKFFVNNQDGTYTESSAELDVQVFKGSWGSVFVDYDNDGDEDLFVPAMTPAAGNSNVFFILDDDEFINISGLLIPESQGPSMGAAKADYDMDGDYDLVVQNGQWLAVELLNNGSAPGNYVSVELEGSWSNREGVGSWIEVFCEGEVYSRYTQLGCNFAGQDSRRVLFGLGNHTAIDSIRVQWPSGIVQVETGLALWQHHLIVESIPSAVVEQDELSSVTISPNPADDWLRLKSDEADRSTIPLFFSDSAGRKFNGRSESGLVDVSQLAPGLYTMWWLEGQLIRSVAFVKR
jgi:hypothetical protein